MATEAEKKEKRHQAAVKAAETRRSNRIAAEKREEGNGRNLSWIPWALLGLALLAALLLWHPWSPSVCPVCSENNVPAYIAPVNTPIPTQVYIAPMPVVCTTPSIRADVNDSSGGSEKGLYLNTNLGERMTFTSRSLLVPGKAYNEVLTPSELKLVEDTWQYVNLCVPEGVTVRLFAGGIAQGLIRYDNGVIMTLTSGFYEFQFRNGEIVIWYPNQQTYSDADLQRIITQIRNGNFDIRGQLALFGVTSDLASKMPADFIVKTIPALVAK